MLRLADGNLSKLKEISTALNRAQEEALDQESKYGAERFGTYFRVKFYGERFPPEVANREFIFREAMAAKLSEVSEKIKDEAELLGFGFDHSMSHIFCFIFDLEKNFEPFYPTSDGSLRRVLGKITCLTE